MIEGSGGDSVVEPRAVALAVLDVLTGLAADTPVLVAVDDFQWLDRPSADALLFALRRLGDESIGVLLAVRGEARGLERDLGADGLSVGPLAPAVLFQILKQRLGLELSPPQLAQLCEVTGGNPFLRWRSAASSRSRRPPRPPSPRSRQSPRDRRRRPRSASTGRSRRSAPRLRPRAADGRGAGRRARRAGRGSRRTRAGRSDRSCRARLRACPLRPSPPRVGLLRGRNAVATSGGARAPGGPR